MSYCETCGAPLNAQVPATVSEMNQRMLSLMHECIGDLEKALRNSRKKAAKDGDPLDVRHNKLLGREVMNAAKSVAALADSVRKYEQFEANSVANMSNDQKLESILSMLESFPPDLRTTALQRLDRLCLAAGQEDGELVE